MKTLQISTININQIKPYKNNPKLHNKKQIAQIVSSIKEFGFVNPILIDENGEIIAGHGRYMAAQSMNMTNVPAIVLSHLSDAQKRMYRIADNKLTELGKWSPELLQIEFKELSIMDVGLDLEITGFETEEIDRFVLVYQYSTANAIQQNTGINREFLVFPPRQPPIIQS